MSCFFQGPFNISILFRLNCLQEMLQVVKHITVYSTIEPGLNCTFFSPPTCVVCGRVIFSLMSVCQLSVCLLEGRRCHSINLPFCYRSQTKFVKVMFSQVFVCPQVGVLCPGVSLSGGVSVQGGVSVRKTSVWLRAAVRILLECILVSECTYGHKNKHYMTYLGRHLYLTA